MGLYYTMKEQGCQYQIGDLVEIVKDTFRSKGTIGLVVGTLNLDTPYPMYEILYIDNTFMQCVVDKYYWNHYKDEIRKIQ